MANYKPDEQEKEIVMSRLRKLITEAEKAAEKMLAMVKKETGASSVEYTLLVVLIACVVVGGYALLGDAVKGLMEVANRLLPF